MDESPYHEGEQALQARLGLRDKLERIGRRVIRDYMPEEHRTFFGQLPWLLVGSLDANRRPWASVVTGAPGFIASPDPYTLLVRASPHPGDTLADHLRVQAPIGLLGLELHTRRRNRMNGRVTRIAEGGFEVRVDQAFGNCPKYINRKWFEPRAVPGDTGAPLVADRLNEPARRLIERADTFFIASSCLRGAGRRYGVDVSHRGGRPGFVRLEADGSLAIPDYVGNFAFNTLGNIEQDGRAGLLFIDFDNGDLLQLTGYASIDWDAPESRSVASVQRLVRVRPTDLRLLPGRFPFVAAALDASPHLDGIGSIR